MMFPARVWIIFTAGKIQHIFNKIGGRGVFPGFFELSCIHFQVYSGKTIKISYNSISLVLPWGRRCGPLVSCCGPWWSEYRYWWPSVRLLSPCCPACWSPHQTGSSVILQRVRELIFSSCTLGFPKPYLVDFLANLAFWFESRVHTFNKT